MCRGNRKEDIFRDHLDRATFLRTLSEACGQTGWIVHSYVLMSNHYHFLIETPEPNLSDGMRWFQGTHAQRFSVRHGVVGHVFQGRYKAPLIEDDEPSYFRVVSSYIHLNPARALLLNSNRPVLAQYKWSSFSYYIQPPSKRPDWLEVSEVLRSFDLGRDRTADRRKYRDEMEFRAREIARGILDEDEQAEWDALRRGWYVGGANFRDRLLDRMDDAISGRKRESLGGRMVWAHDEKAARDLLAAGLTRFSLDEEQVKALPKGDVRKQGLAWLIRTKTSMKNDWVIESLGMGTRTTVYTAVKRFREGSDSATRRVRKTLLNLTI
jgi:REP element-mobilizing transposase RayT